MNSQNLIRTGDILSTLPAMTICIVCGYDLISEYPWGIKGDSPSSEICDCCGTQFGYHDNSISGVFSKRMAWVDSGFKWRVPKCKPENWEPIIQLMNIPSELFDPTQGKEEFIRQVEVIYKRFKDEDVQSSSEFKF